eukprot:TRINITY_DN7167_c0_g1_i1.p3 TRINITY_DN7167_c0_g1~~TRINITY_DN7167_c0_g1_i1.p3  ORF type:complete len:118 (+),score=1.65 TRINITY_DN7167_c0_g1_i1:618-971(+)
MDARPPEARAHAVYERAQAPEGPLHGRRDRRPDGGAECPEPRLPPPASGPGPSVANPTAPPDDLQPDLPPSPVYPGSPVGPGSYPHQHHPHGVGASYPYPGNPMRSAVPAAFVGWAW